MRISAVVVAGTLACAVGLMPAACRSGSDASLETLAYAKSMITLDSASTARVIGDNEIEVDGTATNHDKYQHDVYFTATLWSADSTAVGTATGKLEDWPAGHRGAYKLIGKAPSTPWTRVSVVVSDVKEHVRGEPE